MKILGIDTTTKFLCVGLSDGRSIYEYNLEAGRNLSSFIGVALKRILDYLGWKALDLDYLACGLGPGSFTGMRTGISFIKGMGWALSKPIIGISTLDILALNVSDTDKQIIPAIDAKRNLIYAAVFKNNHNKLSRIKPPMLLSPQGLAAIAKKDSLILGDAAELYKDKILKNTFGLTFLDKDYWYPRPRNIIKLALERIKDKKINNSFDVKPIYLYPKECQIKVKTQKSKVKSAT